jgi:hypothetical protein
VINIGVLQSIGYDPARIVDRIHITTGSGIELVSRLTINRVKALGKSMRDFVVLAHTLPPTAAVDGLLGLDFLRTRRLTLDFRRSTITLT